MKIIVLACAALFSASAQAASCEVDPVLKANKAVIFNALDGIFNKHDANAIDRYFGSPYLQHSPFVADGSDGLRDLVPLLDSESENTIGTQAAEGDLVWSHSHVGHVNSSVVVDVFRVKDGKIVEHWDYTQAEVPASKAASGRPMFPIKPSSPSPIAKGCGAPETLCVSKDVLKANKVLAAEALDAFFNKKDTSAVDKYIGAEYLQHNPSAKDGADQLKGHITSLPSGVKFELGAQIAEDDLVWTQGRYSGVPGENTTITIDIFRVKDGKIVEHWDIAQDEVPAAQTASSRAMFPIES